MCEDGNSKNGDDQNGDSDGNYADNGSGSDDNSDASSGVTSLPETGTGAASTSGALWLATAALMVMTVGAMLIRQKRA